MIYPLTCFPGVVGNALTIFVLSRRNMHTSTNAFLGALAVSDSIKLINDSMYFFVTVLIRADRELGKIAYGYLYPYAHFIFSMSVCVSSWITVSVAVERYILVCHPTRARALWNRRRAVFLCVSIYVIMTSLALPSAFRYRTIRCVDRKTGLTGVEVELTDIWRNQANQALVRGYEWAQNLLRSIIPLLLLVVLNVCIISALRRTKAKRRKNSRHRVTIMMIVVILVFLICITPDAILSTVFDFGYHEAGYLAKGIREITDSLLTINAGVNFIIYCVFNQVFRKSFARICCPTNRQTGWITELDESTYRRLSEAKCLLSTNNNSPPRQNTPPKRPADTAHRYNTTITYSQEDPAFANISKQNGVDNYLQTNIEYVPERHQTSTSTSSSSSVERSHQHTQQQHHHRVSSSGLKKSRNSVKSNRAKKKVCVTFQDNQDNRRAMETEKMKLHELYTLRQQEDTQTELSSQVLETKFNKLSPASSSECHSVFVNDCDHCSNVTSSGTKTAFVSDAENLTNLRVCDGSQIVNSVDLNAKHTPMKPSSLSVHVDDVCHNDGPQHKKRKCLLSVGFVDNTMKPSASPSSASSDDETRASKGEDSKSFTGRYRGSTPSNNDGSSMLAFLSSSTAFSEADYNTFSYFNGEILTTDV